MKTRFLLPHKYKKIGWIFLIPSAIFGLFILFISPDFEPEWLNMKVFTFYTKNYFPKEEVHYFSLVKANVANELAGIFFLISAMLVAFSKAKNEDEFITKIRLESLVWATYLNYAFLLFGLLFIFSLEFLTFMVFNMFTLLILYILKFNLALYKSKRL
jgi:hypothetical protein